MAAIQLVNVPAEALKALLAAVEGFAAFADKEAHVLLTEAHAEFVKLRAEIGQPKIG